MKIASIDIGSNTVLLLIAEVKDSKLTPILNLYKMPRLGKGLLPKNPIAKDRIALLLAILEEYSNVIKEHGCDKIIVTATNAMRIASNSDEIIDLVKQKFSYEIKIVDGDEEARLSYLGASSTLQNNVPRTVIDIGGGSTEIIYGTPNKIKFKQSFQTGVVSLTEKYLTKLPYPISTFGEVENFFDETFQSIKTNIPKNVSTLAVAGTPTTLSGIFQNLKEYDEEKIEGSILEADVIKTLSNVLSSLDHGQIQDLFRKIVKGREDVIFAGSLILDYLVRTLKVPRIVVSSKGIRYGSIIDYIDRLK
ncbi:MAG: hypothetical protein GY936_11000 [Ignavibacteriae bacterium]|nr:hypothetical protein [Ignavibacteriota bacterium]